MGEAKRRRRAHTKVLEAHPHCIYCAGQSPAETAEHMPPLAMFRGRRRPNQLVFPTCKACNNGTGHTDLVASMLGRTYPDGETEAEREEVHDLVQGVANNVPGLIEEMAIDPATQRARLSGTQNVPAGAGALRANGPILSRHMITFGAKLGFALHFELHKTHVPQEGGVQSMYFTNVNKARDELPTDLIGMLPGPPKTLQQGRVNVLDQFAYLFGSTGGGRYSLFYTVFNDAFSIAVVTALDRHEFLIEHADKWPVTAPGDFKR
jgi:hypothetical protein